MIYHFFFFLLGEIIDNLLKEEKNHKKFYKNLENLVKKIVNFTKYEIDNKLKIKNVIIYLLKIIYFSKDRKNVEWIKGAIKKWDIKFKEIDVTDGNEFDYNEEFEEFCIKDRKGN